MTTDAIRFTVPTIPIAQPRQRHAIRGKYVANYTPSKHPVNAFKSCVQMAYAQEANGAPPHDGPVRLTVRFVMPRPKGKIWKNKPMPEYPHTSRPDCDNLLKATLDSLKSLAWGDDAQVWDVRAQKVVASGDESPHVDVTIERLNEIGATT